MIEKLRKNGASFLRLLLLFFLQAGIAAAAPPPAPGSGMVTEHFILPPGLVEPNAFSNPLESPVFPAASPVPPLREILIKKGLRFPPGALAIVDPRTKTVTVRNTPAEMKEIRAFFIRTKPEPVSMINFTLHVVQAPGPLLRLLASSPSSKGDQTEDLQRLLTEAAAPGSTVKILHTSYLRTQDIESAALDSVTERTFVADVPVDAAGRASVVTGQRLLGLSLKLDAYADRLHQAVNVDITSALTLMWEKPRLQTVTEPITGSLQKWEVPEFQEAAIQTSLTLRSGQTRLVSQWPAKGDPQFKKDDVAQGLFLTAHLTLLEPQPKPDPEMPVFPEDPDTPAEWSVQLPPHFIHGLLSDSYMELKAPFAKHAKKRLADYGLQLPENSHVTLDETGKLQVTATAEAVAHAYQWSLALQEIAKPSVITQLEIYRAPAAQIRSLLADSASLPDHLQANALMREAFARGEVRQTRYMRSEGKSLSTIVSESGLDHRYPAGITWSKPSQPSLDTKKRLSGLRLETEAAVHTGNQHIFLDYSLEHHTSPPTAASDILPDPASKRRFHSPRDDFHVSRLQSCGLFSPGVPHIIGAWQPVTDDGRPMEGELEIAFLTCEVFRSRGSPFLSVPPPFLTVSKLPLDKDGMATATLQAGPDFLSINSVNQQDSKLRITAQDVFEGQGISFPKGASASYSNASGLMTVRNTARNLELVELFLRSVAVKPPRSINFHLHLFEAPAGTLQHLSNQFASAEDHTPAVNTLLDWVKAGKAATIASLSLSCRGGHRSQVFHTQEHPSVVSIGLDKNGGSEIKREIVRSGTWMELDPVLDAAGLTSDLNITLENHPAPPMHREENLAVEGDPPVIIPLTDFYRDKITSRLTLSSGTSRIVALWKPAGKPGDVLHIAILQMNTTSAE